MPDLELALDWTPNTNHTGIFVAEAEGYFAEADLDVQIRSPAEDDYAETPAKRVATGKSDLAIAPSESAISYYTHPDYPDLTAVAAVCQRDTSAIVTLAESGIDRPAELDGTTYASYDARFEDHIVRQLIRNDGGDGDIEILTPPKLGIPNTLLEGTADATWVFLPWEGLLAERDGVELNAFRLDDYGVPYGYTPTLLATPETIASDADRLADALDAIGRGYAFAAENPVSAADLLCRVAEGPQLDDREFVRESQRRIAPAYLTGDGDWGVMARERWADFVDWLVGEGILTTLDGEQLAFDDVSADALFTNAFV
jgi:NitT/TauT family transport system substrate-binding protein